jgi:hypothetical protein
MWCRMALLRNAACIVVLAVGLSSCRSATRPSDPGASATTFRVQACSSQTFTVRMHDPQLIQRAADLVGQPDQPILNGTLARGDGGFNQPWSWHLVPGSVQFADLTTEVCDGCPQMVEQDLDYWVDTVGRFCPWSSRIVARLD